MKRQLLILLFPLGCFAQQPALYFDKLTTEHGLSHNKVNCMLQDQRGFLWIGTDDGLNRFDGRRFVQFRHRPHDSTSLSGNIITDLIEDKEGRLWIATADGGLSRYDYRLEPTRQFRQYRHHPHKATSLPVTTVNALLEDSRGFLWLGVSGKSILRFDKNTEQFLDVTRSTKTVLDLCLDGTGKIWVGRQGGGILKVDPASLNYTEDERYRDLYAKLPHVTVTSLYKNKNGDMWFGSWDKLLYRYAAATGKEHSYGSAEGYQPDEVLCFASDRQGRLWMGGRENGLQVFDNGMFYQYRNDPARAGSIAADRVNCLLMDKDGRMWLGTSRGLSINQPDRQRFAQQFLKPGTGQALTVFDFYEDAEQNIWMGTSDGIFIRRPNGTVEHRKLSYNNTPLEVSCFFVDGSQWYLGTSYSLFLYNPVTNALKLLPNTEKDGVMNKIINSRVVSVVKHSINGRPVLLVSPYGHFLTYYDLQQQRWVSRLDSSNIIQQMNLRDNLIRKLYKARNGALWLATSKSGLGVFSNGAMPVASYCEHNPDDASSIANNNVYDLAEDDKGNLWLSTVGGGLVYFEVKAKKFGQVGGSGNLAEGLQPDHRGHVWMISNGNLQQYDPYRKLWSSYKLPDVEKSGGVRGRIFRDSRRRMYVAGNNYFVSFPPDSLSEIRTEPAVVLTDFYIFDQQSSHLLQQEKITLKHRENYFGFEFAAPDFSPGNSIRFAYKLEGFDNGWVDAGDRSYVSYSNLRGGDYTFRVRVSSTPGTWSPHTATVHLTVVPPYWQTLWFYTLCAVWLALLVYAIYRYRINELLKRQAIRNRIAQDLHDNVGSTLSSISVYSQVAKIYFDKCHSGAAQPAQLYGILEKISGASSEMISELNDTVWAINPRNDNMATILQRMDSLARPLLVAQEMVFHFDYDETLTAINLDMEKRKNFYLVFKESVNNVLKYASAKNLWISIRQKASSLVLEIRDDGKGFDLKKTSEGYKSSDVYGGGNGLRNMQQRATALKGRLTVQSEVDKGTSITLQFPIT